MTSVMAFQNNSFSSLLSKGNQACQELYPELQVEASELRSYLGRVFGDELDELQGSCLSDLWLCSACLGQSSIAIRYFSEKLEALRTVIGRYTKDKDDVLQTLSEKLLVGSEGRPPRLWDYSGRGSLSAWLRVVATRAAIDHSRKNREFSVSEEEMLLLPDESEVASTALHKAISRAQWKEAFQAGIAALQPSQRVLLRQHLVDDLSIDEIAPMHNVHRMTVARRLTKIRNEIWSRAKRQICKELKMPGERVESLLGDVRSYLDFSIERVLSEA